MPTRSQDDIDRAHMALAFREASKGIGLTSPNPPVGCVIAKGAKVIARGHHRRAGGAHAEIEAMAAAAPRALRGATAYVTLEPCSTRGRTGACTQALVAAGVARVVYSATDPNPAHSGRGKSLLEEAGVEVAAGLLAVRGEALVRPWAKWLATGLPWTIAKAGASLDGRLTRPRREGQWLTGAEARADAAKLRGEVDAILVGAGTVRADDPALTLRDPAALRRGKAQPWRAVWSRGGELPAAAQVLTDAHRERTLIYRGKTLRAALKDLARRGCVSVLIEGGGQVHAEALRRGLVDELCLYLAPLLCGEGTVPMVAAPLSKSVQLEAGARWKAVGECWRLRALIERGGTAG